MNSLVRKLISVAVLLSVFFFLAGFAVRAQVIGNLSLDGVDISSTPSNPAPNASVTVALQSYSTDLNRASVSWIVNGKALTKGKGMTSITVTSPASGKNLQVEADIVTAEGADISKVTTIQSGDVDLIWETSGYTPPFYRGKVPFVHQNSVTFIAMPHFIDAKGNPIDPSKLIYNWSNAGTALGDQSGYGRQSLILTDPIISQAFAISVQVSSADQSENGSAAVQLTPTTPSITFYTDDPLYGVLYNNAVGNNFKVSHDEVKVIASPFGFDAQDKNIQYNWTINNVAQDSLSGSKGIVLRVNAGQSGSSDIALVINNIGNDILQEATGDFKAIFNTTKEQAADSSAIF